MKIEFSLTSADLLNEKVYREFLQRTALEQTTDPMFIHWAALKTLRHRPKKTTGFFMQTFTFSTTWIQRINATFDSVTRRPMPSTNDDSYVTVRCSLVNTDSSNQGWMATVCNWLFPSAVPKNKKED
jgi:hypothetical protein